MNEQELDLLIACLQFATNNQQGFSRYLIQHSHEDTLPL